MSTLIITVAGIGSRFNKELNKPVLKAIYSDNSRKISILGQQLNNSDMFDNIIIVGGYLFDDLKKFVDGLPEHIKSKILLIYNEHYSDYGSGYSLYLGLLSLPENCVEVIFIEGDLYVDSESWYRITASSKDVISINREVIYSNKAVIIYVDMDNHPHHMYDINHGELEINEPFIAIFNSGQFWKFNNVEKLKNIIKSLNHNQKIGTNLKIIDRYYAECNLNDIEIVLTNQWVNCNTVDDYHKMIKLIEMNKIDD